MLPLKTESLLIAEEEKLRDWLYNPQCVVLQKAVNAEQMALQAEYSNSVLANPLEAIAVETDTSKARGLLVRAARLTIFLEVLEELRDPKHAFVSAKLLT